MKHNHVTRDIKDPGQCEACDQYRDNGIYTLRNGSKVILWRDKEGKTHVNGMGAVITPEGPQ